MNSIIEPSNKINVYSHKSVRNADHSFMTDFKTTIKEAERDKV